MKKSSSVTLHLLAIAPLLVMLYAVGENGTYAKDTTSRDAYVRFDEQTKTWTLGTSMVEEKLQLTGGVYSMLSLQNKLSRRQYVADASRPEEFRITVESTPLTGATGGWVLKGWEATLLSQGEIQLVVKLENNRLRVEKTYVVYPDTSIIRHWVLYQNASSQPMKVSNPYFLSLRVRLEEMNKPILNYMTGGGSFTGSQVLKEVPISKTYTRRFDSTDKLELAEISGVTYGGALPWGPEPTCSGLV